MQPTQKRQLNNYLCCILVLTFPLSWVNISIGSVYRVITLVVFGVWLVQSGFVIRIPAEKINLFWLWTAYTIYVCLSFIWSKTMSESLSNTYGMILVYLTSLIFFSANLDAGLQKNMDICWIVTTIILILMFLFGDTTLLGYSSRQTLFILGTATDANEFGSFFIIGGTIAVRYFIQHKKTYHRIFFAVIFIMCIYAVLMTGSRGALLALLVSVILTMSKRMSFKRTVYTLILASAGIVLIYVAVIPYIPQYNLNRFSMENMLKDGGSGRLQIWNTALRDYLNNNILRQLFGVGYGRYGLYQFGEYVKRMAHNQFLQHLISFGLIGFAMYLCLIFMCAKVFKKTAQHYQGIFWGIMAMSATLTMSASYKLLWLVLFIAMIPEDKQSYR